MDFFTKKIEDNCHQQRQLDRELASYTFLAVLAVWFVLTLLGF